MPLPKAALLDVDGTLSFKGSLIPGATRALEWLRQQGIAVRLLTNIDSRAPATLAHQLAEQGLEVHVAEVFTPVMAARQLLMSEPSGRAYPLLNQDVSRFLEGYLSDLGQAAYVIVGDCRELEGYERLNTAFRQVLGGAELLALSKGLVFDRHDGPALDTGSFV
jgi:ribonucleotide monophosphatase NagD (HAD superfamily)